LPQQTVNVFKKTKVNTRSKILISETIVSQKNKLNRFFHL